MRPGVTLTAAGLADVVTGQLAGDLDPNAAFALGPQRVSIHSAHVEPGALFVALTGRRDGHDWAAEAVEEHKAGGAIVDRRWSPPSPTLPLVRVDDPLAALHALAAWYRDRLTAHVVAVVGSLGKTTTKDALVSFLGESAWCYGSPGSFNSQLGVPLSVLWCPADAEVAVFEAAATEPGEMARLARVLRPDTLVVTTIGDRFRRSFGSADAYAAELATLAGAAGDVVCGDPSGELARHVPRQARLLTPSSNAWPVSEIARSPGAATISVDGHRIEVPTSSSWVAGDVALAAATASVLGHRPVATTYAPTSVDLQTWRSPTGVNVLRSAAVDEPMAWRTSLADAFATADGDGGRVLVVLSDAADDMSPDTLATLAGGDRTPSSVLVTAGRAADLLARSGRVPLQVFATASELSAALAADAVAGDVVSVVTGRGELIEGISRSLLEAMAPIKLHIDVGAIALNVSAIRRQCPGARVMAVVKAGAYGADAPELARHLATAGVDQFAVSHADEGVYLRRSGITAPVLVLLATPDELAKARRAHLTVCVHSPELLRAVLADPAGVIDVHVEVDTGLRRTGLEPATVVAALQSLAAASVSVTGLMTHLSSADDAALDDVTTTQLATFDAVVDAARAAGVAVPARHVLASAGVCRFPEHAMEMVRVGLALHGIAPSNDCGELPLVPSMTLTSRLIDRRVLAPGDRVGYGATFEADRSLITGVVQLGYHDGIFRSFQHGGAVVVEGHRCRVVGRISMDSMVVDLSACPEVEVGTDVVVFGCRGDSAQAIEDVAEAMGTIPYEVIARLGPRVQRVFVRH